MTMDRLPDAASSEFDEEYDQVTRRDGRTLSGFVFSEPLGHVPRRETVTVQAKATIAEAVRTMNDRHCGCVLVLRDDRLAGIFTERDVLTKVACNAMIDPSRTPVEKVMTPDPDTLPPSASIGFALAKMTEEGYRHIPLVDDKGAPVGVVAARDIIAWLVELLPAGVATLPPDPSFSSEIDGG